MKYRRGRDWESPEGRVTPENVFFNRRKLLAGGAAAVAAGGLYASGVFSPAMADLAGAPFEPQPKLNPSFADAGRAVTDENTNATYNNFYEFGSHKRIYDEAQKLATEGWTVQIDGMVEKPLTISTDDLIAKMPIEERIVRHRCVEAWAMVVPWIGFELSALLNLAAPLSGAKYVRFESFHDPQTARGQRQAYYPWPYTEGLTIEEAANELTFMVVGAYGKVLHKQFGAPIRLHTPWKYGFKAVKSITRITLTDEQPVSFWEELQAREYGFWANVNPEVSHPRWSQATEEILGTGRREATQLFNGYGEQVAHLYAGLEEKLGDRLYR